MKKRNTYIIIGVVVVIALFVIGALRSRSEARAELGELQTEEITFGSLIATVGGTGSVRANQSADINWQTGGTVGDVAVGIGEDVSQGELLANLVQTSLSQNIILAQADLADAQDALDDFYDSYEESGIAAAAKDVADAEDALRDAEVRVNNLNYVGSQQDVDSAYAELVIAENSLDGARRLFSYLEDKPDTNVKRASAYTQYVSAQDAYDAALRNWNYIQGGTNDIDLAQGMADLEVARLAFDDANADFENVVSGPSAQDVAAAEARVAAAQATLNLSILQAPFDGIITIANAQSGDRVSTGSLGFRLDDLSRLVVDVDISEIDINRVHVGQVSTMVFDAILAKEYTGKIFEVSPVGVISDGVVSFNVTVEIADADELVKPGMTAAVNIVVTELENTLLVPNRAVRLLDGERVVYIIKDNQLEPVMITLGASSDTHSEILDGELKDGDEVVLNPPTEFRGPSGPPGGPGGH
ncbi:MAG: efflux RND transporter periplasmic adaptor subunit [Chloroflexota bacterium]